MQCDSGVKRQRPKKFFDQTQIEGSGGILFEINPIGKKWPVGDVQDDPSMRLDGHLVLGSSIVMQQLHEPLKPPYPRLKSSPALCKK